MAGLLDYGAGASSGLEAVLERRMKEQIAQQQQQRIDEEIRSNMASEALGRDTLQENTALRQVQQAALDEDRKSRREAALRDDIRARVNLRSIGAEVSPEEYDEELKIGRIPLSAYEQSTQMSGDDASEPRSLIKFKGTQPQLIGEERLKVAQERAEAAEASARANREISQHRENRLTNWGPPTVIIGDPNTPGGARVIGRDQLPTGGAAAPLPSPERQKVDAYRTTIDMVDDILAQGEKTKWGGVGPIAGPVGGALMKYGGIGDPEQETLRNMLNQLKAQASFAEGGKQFTGTERQMLESFLAGVNQNPQAAILRLKQFRESAQRYLDTVGAGPGPNKQPTKPGAAPAKKLTPEELIKKYGG